eukprot:IDg20434t1
MLRTPHRRRYRRRSLQTKQSRRSLCLLARRERQSHTRTPGASHNGGSLHHACADADARPVHVRHLVRDALTDLLWEFVRAPSHSKATYALRRIFTLPKCVLAAPPATRSSAKPSASAVTKLVKERLCQWRASEYGTLWKQASRGAAHSSAVRETAAEMAVRNAARAVRLAHEGAYSRAAQALQSNGVCEASVAVHQVLMAKHPQQDAAMDGTFPLPPMAERPLIARHVPFKRSEVRFRRRVVLQSDWCWGSGLSAVHLLELLRTPCNKQDLGFLAALTGFCNRLGSGDAPPDMAEWIAAAAVVPAEEARRTSAAAHLMPSQVGVAVRGGAEATVHACRRMADELGSRDDYALLQLDFANAFNLVSRPAFLRVPWLWNGDELAQRYGGPARRPAEPHAVCAAVGEVMKDLWQNLTAWAEAIKAKVGKEKQPGAPLAVFYCDDGVFFAKHGVLARVLEYFAAPFARSYGCIYEPLSALCGGLLPRLRPHALPTHSRSRKATAKARTCCKRPSGSSSTSSRRLSIKYKP